jgi:dTDP-glucose pyrophosphorylase
MLGIVPAAGRGSRIQPLGFSKELLPVGSTMEGSAERPCAVSEYLVQRMILAGADRICFVIGPGKSDILAYYAAGYQQSATMFVVQPEPAGLCDAIFCAAPFVRDDETVLIGLPDTIWYPETGYSALPEDRLAFLLFPVEHPQFFDAVVLSGNDEVARIEVKNPSPSSHWVWGAISMPSQVMRELRELWLERGRADEYLGTLVNEWLERGGKAAGVRAGTDYVDVGTLNGFRAATDLLGRKAGAASIVPLRRRRNG